jgi:hypothetical protein
MDELWRKSIDNFIDEESAIADLTANNLDKKELTRDLALSM